MTREQILARQRELFEGARVAGRAMTDKERAEFDSLQSQLEALDARAGAEGEPETPEGGTPAADPEDAQRAIAEERARVAEISGIARSFDLDPAQAIADGTTVDAYRAAVLEQLRQTRRPIGARAQAEVTRDEEDKFRSAAVDGLIMRNGDVQLTNPAEGASNYRGTTLRDIGIECLQRDGMNITELLRMSPSEIYDKLGERQFYNPSASFPAIMDQTIRKSIVEMYNHVGTTFEQITTKGSLSDFKETADHEYVYGGVGEWLEVPENGEIKPDMPRTELLPKMQLKTYGKQFSMTRQAFVNDDIGFLTRLPGLYAQRAKETIDKQVYDILFDNATIFDGKTLFHSDHENVMGSGAAPSAAVIQAMILKMQLQKDQFGDYIYINPRQVIVPVGYEFVLDVIFHSAQVVGSANNDINPLYNYPLGIVQTPRLNAKAGASACPWFLQADAASCRGIQVNYLNGQETPTVRRMETVGQLGFTWDMWLDWGVCVRDYRGFVKNPGTTLS